LNSISKKYLIDVKMKPKEKKDLAKPFPISSDWSPPGTEQENIVIDHPVFRHASKIALGVGIALGLSIFIFNENAPWWMPVFVCVIVSAILYRILRPRLRHPSIEDEI
jgi:uncharacterized membrane protein YccC